MIDETLAEIARSHAYRVEWDRRFRRLDRAFYAFHWTGYGWQALAVAWTAVGMVHGVSWPTLVVHGLACLGLATLHGHICVAIVRRQERICDEMASEATRIAAYLGRG